MQNENENVEQNQSPQVVNNEVVQPVQVETPPIVPVPAPTLPPTPVLEPVPGTPNNIVAEPPKKVNNPGVIVLQWLVYAFWGWTVLAMCIMTWAIISYYMDGLNISDGALYGVAALLVLLPLSLGCDIFYHKVEPESKTGVASVIMIIHSVIFALFGIGALISAVLSGVNLLIGTSTVGVVNTLLTSLIVFGVYLLVFLRTILPKKIAIVRTVFLATTTISIVIICIASFAGPIASKKLLQYDAKLDTGLNEVADGIESYVDDNYKLPSRLSDIDVTDATANDVVDQGLISYTQKGDSLIDGNETFYYQLCVTYKASTNGYAARETTIGRIQAKATTARLMDDEYSTYLSTYSHPAGEKCYKMKVIEYSYEMN